jgi:hypothetical protein
MKKHCLFILVLVISTFSVRAQSFAWPGAEWNYVYFPQSAYGRLDVKPAADTVIMGETASILKQTAIYQHRTGPGPQDFAIDTAELGTLYMYKDGGKVFWYNRGQFHQLYDLNAKPGDTLRVPEIDHFDPPCDSFGTIVVDSAGVALVNGAYLAYIVVHPVQNSTWGYSGRIYDRIGPLTYLLPSYTKPCIVDYYEMGPLRCYKDSMVPVFKRDTVACDFVAGMGEIAGSPVNIKVYPNPAHDKLYFSASGYITIYDLTGRCLSFNSSVRPGMPRDISNLKDGVYFVRLVTESGEVGIARFVKENAK